MTNQLRKIIRPKPYLTGLEISLAVIINLIILGGYLFFSLEAISWSHKAHYLFWLIWLILNHLFFTLVTDSLTHHLTAGYELTDEHLIIVKTSLLTKPRVTKIPLENLVSVNNSRSNRVELVVKHSPKPEVCRILANGELLCREIKEHWRLYNLKTSENNPENSLANLSNNPRFILVDNGPTTNQ